MTRLAMNSIFALLFLVFLVYFGVRMQYILQGPQITITSPAEGEFLSNTHVLVVGEGFRATRLELNGRPIYTDENGFFEERLILAPGLNMIELKADGRFGRQIVELRTIMVKLPE
ncbi:hypothetical protein IIA95_01430 [Patescibacteria group bacterium]|nr:hypothetical protein [Patescibacteria group bacterium]